MFENHSLCNIMWMLLYSMMTFNGTLLSVYYTSPIMPHLIGILRYRLQLRKRHMVLNLCDHEHVLNRSLLSTMHFGTLGFPFVINVSCLGMTNLLSIVNLYLIPSCINDILHYPPISSGKLLPLVLIYTYSYRVSITQLVSYPDIEAINKYENYYNQYSFRGKIPRALFPYIIPVNM